MIIRYSRLWGLGNYENEKVELEREFPDTVSFTAALDSLVAEVEKDHERRVKIRAAENEVIYVAGQLHAFEDESKFMGLTESEYMEKLRQLKAHLKKAKANLRKLQRAN